MKALIVEDDLVTQKMLVAFLGDSALCDVAANGEDGYELYLQALDDDMPYELICVDVNMPLVDGIEFLQAVREEEVAREIVGDEGVKVVFVSGVTDPKDLHAALSAGCAAYLTKPLDRKKFIAELTRLGFVL